MRKIENRTKVKRPYSKTNRLKIFAILLVSFGCFILGGVSLVHKTGAFSFGNPASRFTNPAATPTPLPPQTAKPKRNSKLKFGSANSNTSSEQNLENPLLTTSESNLAPILATVDFNMIGLVGTASPANQTVPKNTPTAVLTSIQLPEGEDAAAIIAQLNPNYRIKGELIGPSFNSPRQFEVPIGEQIPIPPMPVVGDHVLQNLRIVDASDVSRPTIAPVTPDAVGITVIDNILVTQVQVTEMTHEQIVQSGINLSTANYNFYNFVLALGTSSGTVPIQIPVAMPTVGGQQPVIGNPVGGVGVSGVAVPDIVPIMLQGETQDGQPSQIPLPEGEGGMQIPGVIVFPGRIGLLHQFFEAVVIVANGAPNGTPLVITNLRATANLPDAGTPNNPADDPLKIAETQQGGVQRQLEIHGLGPDGRYGTADDTTSFNPGQSGQATFLLEGLKEGLHTVDFDIRGTLQGLPGGNINIRGNVPGAVLVRDAQFGVTFTHPSVVRAGQEYDLGLTVFNSGNRNLNGVDLSLRANGISGAELIDAEVKTLTQTIRPGESGTVKWRLRSLTTGQVTASYVKVGEGIDAGLNLVTGVGDRNVPLSPDSLILPNAVNFLPPDVVEAARQMLGQAWSVATAPRGSLPSGVLPVEKQTVVGKAIELGWAGLRIQFHEERDTSLRTLLRDWLGENQASSSTGFADALRNTPAGYYFYDTIGTKFYETVGNESPVDFHKKLVDAESSRSAFISAFVSQSDGQSVLGAKIISPTNQSVGSGANPGERFGELRAGAALNLLQTDPHNAANNTKGNLLVVSKPASGNWILELNGWTNGQADVSILAPTTGKNYRQLVFSNVAVTPGKHYRITFKSSGTTAPAVEEFINGAFRPANLTFTSYDVADPNPVITGVIQVSEDVIEGGDNYGRLVGVLFSKPMTKTSVETSNRYQIGGGELVSDPSQMVGKLIKPTSALQNFGERFSIVALDAPVGPFIKRNLTVNGITDKTGKVITGVTKDIEMRVSPRGKPAGAYITGRVMQADGTPVPNAGIYLRRKIPPIQGTACSGDAVWETISYLKADANGEYTFDFIIEERCNPVTAIFQNPATNSEKTIVSNVAYHGQHLIFNAVFLARGNVQGTVTSGGVPLANASVSILSELDPLNNKLVKTNAQGFYSATGVPVGGVTVKAVGTGNYSLSSGIAAGNIDAPNATATVNVTTQNVSGVVKGRVLDNGSGQTPVRNAVVIAKAFIPGFPSREPIGVGYSYTDDNGNFTIERLPIGNVFISGYDPQRGASNSSTVQLTEQNPRVENVILLVSNGFGRVSGRVLNEVGQIIPNAVVQEGAQQVQADASGNYVLPMTREGNVTVRATDPVSQLSGSSVVSVRRNEDTNNADIIIRRPANLNGQVFISENGTTAPLAQAYVTVDGFKIVRTDAQGRYTLNNVESGRDLTIRFVNPQGKLFINTNVFLNPGETISRNATFKPARVHGKITQPDGRTPVVTGVTFKTLKPAMTQGVFFGLPQETFFSYQTTTNGLYSFESLNPIEYRISSSNVFFPVPVSRTGILPPNANLEINLSLVDTLTGKIHGHIYQPDGVTPVGAGVKVSLGGGNLGDVTVRTDASGYYEFAEVFSADTYALTATDPSTGQTNRTYIDVKKNEEMEVNLRLLGRGKLKVKVVDGGGVPLQTGSIEIQGANYPNDERYVELTPNNNGEFEFTNLNEGNYAVSALYLGLGGRGAAAVTLGGTTEITIQVQAVGKITGRVFMPDAATAVGLADVRLLQNGRTIGLITTDDSEENRGKFNFDYVPTGEFTIEVFDNRTGRKGRTAGRITAQGEIADVRVNLLALGTVVGQVTSNGTPAAHALVYLSADGSGISATSRIATTDSDGRFRFPGIPVGHVSVTVTDGPGGLTGQSQGTVSGTIEPLPDTVIDVALTPSATITGTIRKFGGSEIYPGVAVTVSSNGFRSNTTTDANGRYRVEYVPLGTVNVKAEAPAGYDRGKTAPIISNIPGGTVVADITMTGVGSISGIAYGSNGSPLSFGKVTFTNDFWNEGITISAPVQPDGTYSMAGLPTGDFNLKLTVPEIIGVGTAADSLSGGQTLTKNLQLESAGKVFGSVRSTDGTSPAVGADVVLTLNKQGQINQSYRFVTHTDSSGNWEFSNLPLGTINLRILDPNSDGVARISGLNLETNGQEINTGTINLDNAPIAVESVTPADGAIGVPRNTAVQILFTEPADPATVNSSSVRLTSGGSFIGTNLTLSADGRTATLTPNQILDDTTLYSTEVSTAVQDLNGIGLANAFSSSFTTNLATPLAVESINPNNGALNVPQNTSIQILFTEPINPATVNSSSVMLKKEGYSVSTNIEISADGRTVTLVPVQTLEHTTLYTTEITTNVKNINGIALANTFISNFTTTDLLPPVVISTVPGWNAAAVPVDQIITVTFNEVLGDNQQLSDIVKILTWTDQEIVVAGGYDLSTDRKTVTFMPSESLVSNARYQILVNGQRDGFGNTQNNPFSTLFTTTDTIAPTISWFKINGRQAADGMTISTPQPAFDVSYEDNLGIDTQRIKFYLYKVGEPATEVQAQVYNWRLYYTAQQPLSEGTYKVRAVIPDFDGNEAAGGEFEFTFAPQQPEILSLSDYSAPTSGNSVITINGSQLVSGFENSDDSAARGLLAEYYDCSYNNCLNNVELVRLDENVNVENADESVVPTIQSYNEAIRWRGKIIPRYTETYNLEARFNGNFIVKIDGEIVLNGHSFNVGQTQEQISFEAGRSYDIEIQSTHFYQNGDSFQNQKVAQFFWSSPSQPKEIVPAEQLRPARRAVAPSVTVGGNPATVIGAVSGDTDQIAVIVPSGIEGYADVQVQNANGTATLSGGLYYYADQEAPDFFSVSPSFGKLLNAPPARVSLTFNEPLAAGQNLDNILKVYKTRSGSADERIGGTVSIDETSRRLKFVPTDPFPANTAYKIVVEGQTDTVGNVGAYNYTTFTVDGAPPTITFTSPGTVTYSQRPKISAEMSDVSGSIRQGTIKLFIDGADVTGQASIYYRCTTWFCDPNLPTSVSYTPSAALPFGAHTARVQASDSAGNVADETLNFTISPDTTPPIIDSVKIAGRLHTEGFQTAERQPDIDVRYQDNSLITHDRQKLYFGPQGGTLEQVTPNGYRGYMYYTPDQPLPFGLYSYRIELIDDQNNTTVRTVNFEVADLDVTPPQVTATTPENWANQVDANTGITVTFSEPLDPNQNFSESVILKNGNNEIISGSYQLNTDGTVLNFTPAEPLPDNSIYIISASGYRDLAGNTPQYGFESYFATNDTVAPYIDDAKLYIEGENGNEQEVVLNGAETLDRTPRISVSFGDATNYVDSESIVFTLDGQQITSGVLPWGINYEPETPLSYGEHTITVRVADIIGNVSDLKTETFSVKRDPRTPFAVEADTTLLWRLDEEDNNARFTPDAGDYRIHGILPIQYGLAEQKALTGSGSKKEPKNAQTADGQKTPKTEQKNAQKTSESTLFEETQHGRFDGAIKYPSLTSINDQRIASLGNAGFTVEGWIKLSLGGAANPYTVWAKGSESAKDFELLLTPEGVLKARIYNSANEVVEIVLPKETYDITDDQWHSLAMTVESAGNVPNQLKLYIDGELRSGIAVPQNFGTIRNSGGEFYLGFNTNFDSYPAMFDEVRVSSTAHSAETISKTFNSPELGLVITRLNASVIPSGNTTSLIVEGYNLDVVSGLNFTDLNGNPVAATATITDAKKTVLKADITVDSSVPNGDVRLNMTDGSATVSRTVRIAPQQAFAADAGTLMLFNMNEPFEDVIVNSGTLGGTGYREQSDEVINARYGNGRKAIVTGEADLTQFINSSFTAEFWLRTEQPEKELNVMVYGENFFPPQLTSNLFNQRLVELTLSTRGELKATLTDDNEHKWTAVTQIGEVNLLNEQWHLVSLVVMRGAQPSENILKIYIDGAEKASAVMPAEFTTMTAEDYNRIYLNRFGYNANSGGVDDFRFLSYARTASEIQNTWFGLSNSGGIGVLLPKQKTKPEKEPKSIAPNKFEPNKSEPSVDNVASTANKKTYADKKHPADKKSLVKTQIINDGSASPSEAKTLEKSANR